MFISLRNPGNLGRYENDMALKSRVCNQKRRRNSFDSLQERTKAIMVHIPPILKIIATEFGPLGGSTVGPPSWRAVRAAMPLSVLLATEVVVFKPGRVFPGWPP